MFEDRFGRGPTTAIVAIVVLAIVVFCGNVIVNDLVVPVYNLIHDHFGSSVPESNVITIFYVVSAAAAIIMLIPAISFLWRHRGVPQSVLDRLSELRANGVSQILNADIQNKEQLEEWKLKDDAWTNEVLALLKKHFPRSEQLLFEYLGAWESIAFGSTINPEHYHRLQMHNRRLWRIEDILGRNSR